MDNDAFRDTYRTVNTRACVFEKTILTHNGACSLAQKFCTGRPALSGHYQTDRRLPGPPARAEEAQVMR
jgi:hypothetical protein